MSERSKGYGPESSTQKKNEGLPKKENYESEDEWEEDMWQYFAGKVVLTDEEYEAYMEYIEHSSWEILPSVIASEDFEIRGERYSAVAIQFPSGRPPHEWYTRIFVVKEK